MIVDKRGFGVAEDAAEGDLSRGRLEVGDSITLGALCGLDVELCAMKEELVALKMSSVGVAPGAAADVVDITRGTDGEDESRRLDVVELLYVAGKDINQGLRDACKDDALDVTVSYRQGDLVVKPCGKLIVVKVADGDIDSIREGQGLLAGDG